MDAFVVDAFAAHELQRTLDNRVKDKQMRILVQARAKLLTVRAMHEVSIFVPNAGDFLRLPDRNAVRVGKKSVLL